MNLDTPLIPKTLDDVAKLVISRLDLADLAYIREPGRTSVEVHFGAGMTLRNELDLWHENALTRWFKDTYGVAHGDDLSGLILDAVYADVRGEPRKTDELVASFKQHWARYGVDPITGKDVA